jgi:hypothetical protein
MQIRFLAGFKRLAMTLVIASLVVAPAGAATPLAKSKAGGGTPLAAGGGVDTAEVDASKAIEPVLYVRSNYVWPFAAGPVYGTVDASQWKSAGVLHTQVGSFDLTRGLPNFPSELKIANRLGAQPTQYFLLQVRPEAFTNGSFDQLKAKITAEGGVIVGEMPVAAFVVRMTPGALNAAHNAGDLVALEPFQPAFKLSPEIGRVPLPDAARANSNVYSLELRLFPGENSEAAARIIGELGVQVTKTYGDTVFVQADRTKLAALAAVDAVYMIHEVLPIYPMSEETTSTVQTGKWNNGLSPYNDAGIDGGGLNKASQADDQLMMMLDTGIQLDAADLSNTRTSAGLDVNGNPIAGHRKVAFYGTTNAFGGQGDLLGCDGSTTSGVTHGHTTAVIALGNASNVPAGYGAGYTAIDGGGNSWKLDGLAPKARLIAYDAQVTPLTGRCDDPTQGNLTPGDLYTAPSGGSLADGYAKGARISVFSWGAVTTQYDADTIDIDQFLFDKADAMVFVAAGNSGRDKNGDRIPDPNTIGTPATAKNALIIGAGRNSDDLGDPDLANSRWTSSSNGPATTLSGRMAPVLMAPGTDAGTTGLASEFTCRSNDNSQSDPVECDVISGQISTSYANAAAAGAGLLVRDYFAQGFYPDGTNTNPGNAADQVSTISGALLKAILITSADWMNQPGTVVSQQPTNAQFGTTPDFFGFQGALTRKFRGNREQGYGRIILTSALPLQTSPSTVSGLIVGDGGGAPAGLINSTTLNLKVDPGADSRTCSLDPSTSCTSDADCTGIGTCVPYTLNVCDTSQPLTVAISWIDPSITEVNARDLNLELTSPSGRVYIGNFFTDDINDDAAITGSEECTYSGQPWPADSVAGAVDTGPWSLPISGTGVTCTSATAHVDTVNNVEAIFLSPDSRLNGINDDPATAPNEALDNQIEQGAWKVNVKAAAGNSGAQNYSIAIAGGVCLGSAARIQKVLPLNQLAGGSLTCNDSAVVTIDETATASDPIGNLTTAEIASRTTIQVIAADGVTVTDTETFAAGDFTIVSSAGGNLRFDSRKILLSEGTAPDSGNGALDVRDGQSIRVTYNDESGGSADPNQKRVSNASVNCKPVVSSGGVVFTQFGKDAFTLVAGGCEKDARGYFTFGFPDRYMDAGELLSYTVAFQSAEQGTKLLNLSISLRAVVADADSPANCKPGSVGVCADPNRTNNAASTDLTVLDSPKVYGSLPAGQTITPTFTIQMANSITGTKKIDMLIGVTSRTAGKGNESLIAQRETLNADENPTFYSTDFPLGGSEPVGGYDSNNNEILEAVTTNPRIAFADRSGRGDYTFETRSYGNMTATGTNSLASVQGPWNFDTCSTGGKCTDGPGGFVSGLQNTSRPSAGLIALWGEDKNFNGRLDGFCSLDNNLPCTQGVPISENCQRCSGDPARECNVNADCQVPPAVGTCVSKGTCNFTLGEDRDPSPNGVLDKGWSTAGGCGWQTKSGLATGGVWHTGVIRDLSTTTCLAAGFAAGRCQSYETLPDGDLVGDNDWWELLLTPVLNKVDQTIDVNGDPNSRIEITDWAFNMLADLPDDNTSVRLEFDTDINKSAGAELFNDAGFTVGFAGKQGPVVGGNGPITDGFNMFARVSHCVDTDGNGTPDHCGTALGKMCGSDQNQLDLECTGNDLSPVRGICITPPAQKKCTGTMANCTIDANCPAIEHCVFDNIPCTVATQAADCAANGGSCVVSGTGNNREGDNNCFFEGKVTPAGGTPRAKSLEPFGLSWPPDDDAANGYCNRSDGLTLDKSQSCMSNTDCAAIGAPYTTCNLSNHPGTAIDAFVQANGPGRNYSVRTSNGPDMRLTTLEDFYGDTGNQFRAALGFRTREADANTTGGTIGYGVAIDDMVISWKEVDLITDTTDCAGSGACADLETSTGVSFEGNSVVNITVTDVTPYDPVNNVNDCNGNGTFTDVGIDDQDCNNNGKLDVTVKLTSTAEVAGEIAVLDAISPGSAVYKANFPYSTFYNSPGTLFVVQSGNTLPVITARYDDRNDGTGSRCKNALDPTQQGFVTATTSVNVTTGRITVQSYKVRLVSTCSLNASKQCTINSDCLAGEGTCFTCSILTSKPCDPDATSGTQFCTLATQGVCTSTAGRGDPDGFADDNETINLQVQFANKSGLDVDDLTATLGTNSPNISCVTRSAINVGSLASGALSNIANYPAFQFKVGTVGRTNINQVLQTTFTLTIRSNKFDALTRAVEITIDLDLNAAGTATTSAFVEDFENLPSAGFGKFTLDTLDAGKTSVALSNGYRCQYNDPFGLNSYSVGNTDCFLGFTGDPASGVNDWHIHTSTHGGMGRAFTGKQSLHLGVHINSALPDLDTTRLKQLDAIKTINPINMPLSGSNAELNFAQQISIVDNTAGVNVTNGEGVDRGVVEVQLQQTGVGVGSWIKIYPYVNIYDQQGENDFSNCIFDPVDDGNNEDSYFDPTDPARLFGPSSTCWPEFVFVRQGQTDYRKTFDVSDIGAASDGPGLQGCSGAGCLPANTPTTISNPGTWVRPRFSLVPFAGRTIKLRFIFTSIEVGATQTMNLFFGRPNVTGDDGWFIDDIHIDSALGTPLTLSADTASISALSCGACSAVTPGLTATPSSLSGPGQIVTLDAKTSTVDRCINGVVQYQFWADTNTNGVVGDGPDALLRDWTDNSQFVDAPSTTTQYGLKARCSTDINCDSATNSIALNVPVTCPSTATLTVTSIKVSKPDLATAEPDSRASVSGWGGNLTVKVVRGNLATLRSSGGVVNVDSGGCLANSTFVSSVTDNTAATTSGSYFLLRTPLVCNVPGSGSYSENLSTELPGAGGNRDTDIAADADACP